MSWDMKTQSSLSGSLTMSSAHWVQSGLQSWVVQLAEPMPPVLEKDQEARPSLKLPPATRLAQTSGVGDADGDETDGTEEADEAEETEEIEETDEADGETEAADETDDTEDADDTDETGEGLRRHLLAVTPSMASRPTAKTLKMPFIVESRI